MKTTILIIAYLLFTACAYLWGGGPERPGDRTLPPDPVPAPHRFWDRQNKFLIFTGAGLRAADVLTTRELLRRGGEEYVMPARLVENTAKFAAFSAGAAAVTAWGMFWSHHSGHHRLERALGWLQVACLGAVVTNNSLWLSNHRQRH